MPTKYQSNRERKIKQRQNDKKKKIFVTSDEVICINCNKPSGWENDVLKFISGTRELKCKKCGKVCIKIDGK